MLVRRPYGKTEECRRRSAGNKTRSSADRKLYMRQTLAGSLSAGGLEEASFELRVAIKRLLKNIKTESTVSKEVELSGVKLPKARVPHLMERVLIR